MSDPLVSVIVPVYNAAPFLDESLRSVLAQEHRPLEVLVVDDGSTDGSVDVAEALAGESPEVRLLRRRRNAGPAAARNAALAAGRGDFLTFLDADDRMPADRLSYQLDYLARRPEVDAVIGAQEVVVEPGAPLPGWLRQPAEERPRHYPMSVMARRGLFDRVGGFDERLRVGSDADWLYRAAAAGARLDLVDRVLVHRRIHGANLTYRAGELGRTILGSLRDRIAERRTGLVSVIIPFFDARPYLAEAVESVLGQTYRPLEVLVVDDGSTDGGAEAIAPLLERHGEIRLLRMPRNEGPAAARNGGLRAARGEFVTFLDADDLMLPDRLAVQVDYLRRHQDIELVTGSAEYVLEPGVRPPKWLREPPAASRRRYRNPMTMLARRKVFDRIGPFDPTYRVGEDTEWLLRARAAGLATAHLDRVLIRRRIHGSNLTYRAEESRRSLRRTVLGLARGRIAEHRRGR